MTSSETPVPLCHAPTGSNSGWLFLQRIYSEMYSFCSIQMSIDFGDSALASRLFRSALTRSIFLIIEAAGESRMLRRARPDRADLFLQGIYRRMCGFCSYRIAMRAFVSDRHESLRKP